MIINALYDASMNSAPAGYKQAIAAAIQYMDTTFGGNVTINVHFGWGEVDSQSIGSGFLAENIANGAFYSYSQLRNALVANATSSTDSASLGSLPTTDPPHGGNFWLTDAMAVNLKVASVSNIQAWVGLDSTSAFTWDPNNRAVVGKYDAVGTIEHELSEVMGRDGYLGKYFATGVSNDYGPLDLFRYSSPGVRDFTGNGYFSADGGQTMLTKFNNPKNGGDAGDWDSSVQGDSFGDGYLGQASPLTATDLKVMDVLGYSLLAPQQTSFTGTSGNDTFTSTSLNETFDGQAGDDTVIYHGSLKGYVLTRNGSVITVADGTSGRDGTDSLTNIEHIQFTDLSVNTTAASTAASISKGTLDSIVQLYAAYFNRVPTATGLSYWVNQVNGGESLSQVAKDFYAAGLQYSQYTGYTAATTNTDFINLVYNNVLARSGTTAPSTSEIGYWNGLLQSGAIARPDLIATMLTAAHAFANDPTWGWVSKLLDNKVALGEYVAVTKGIDYLTTSQEFTQSVALLAQVTPTGYANAVTSLGIDQNVFI